MAHYEIPVLTVDPYTFYFDTGDLNSRWTLIHVKRGEFTAAFNLNPFFYSHSKGFSPSELLDITALFQDHGEFLMQAWNDVKAGKYKSKEEEIR